MARAPTAASMAATAAAVAAGGEVAKGNLRVGGRVRLTGLKAREDLNGVEVELLGPHGERWAVRCVRSGECLRVKPVNTSPTPDLHARFSGNHDMLQTVLRQCDGESVRTTRAVDRELSKLANEALRSSSPRTGGDAPKRAVTIFGAIPPPAPSLAEDTEMGTAGAMSICAAAQEPTAEDHVCWHVE